MTPHVYDLRIDADREATQDDVDRLQRTAAAFGELVKHVRFHLAELRASYVTPGQAIAGIEHALLDAERTAACLDLANVEVGTRHVLVIQR